VVRRSPLERDGGTTAGAALLDPDDRTRADTLQERSAVSILR
jgi:hypothetical protein